MDNLDKNGLNLDDLGTKVGKVIEQESSPPSLVKKRTPLKKYWSGTFWLDKVEHVNNLNFIKKNPYFSKAIFGEEICPTTGKIHYQTFIAFNKNQRVDFIWNYLKKKFPNTNGFGWLEPSYASEEHNENYCSKDGKVIKWGDMFDSDWKINANDLNEEQLAITKIFETPEDPKFGRKIYWFWEPKGGWGKSLTATYMIDQMGATEVSGAKKDVLFGISTLVDAGKFPKIVVIDIPRVNKDSISIQAIEMVKNGKFFNEKYESGMCRFPRPHICVFANCLPDTSKMSKDRWVIRLLCPKSYFKDTVLPELKNEFKNELTKKKFAV